MIKGQKLKMLFRMRHGVGSPPPLTHEVLSEPPTCTMYVHVVRACNGPRWGLYVSLAREHYGQYRLTHIARRYHRKGLAMCLAMPLAMP